MDILLRPMRSIIPMHRKIIYIHYYPIIFSHFSLTIFVMQGLLQSETVMDGSNQVGFFGKCLNHGDSSVNELDDLTKVGLRPARREVCARTEVILTEPPYWLHELHFLSFLQISESVYTEKYLKTFLWAFHVCRGTQES